MGGAPDEKQRQRRPQYAPPLEHLLPMVEQRVELEQEQLVPLVQPLHEPRDERVDVVPQHRLEPLPLLLRRR